MSIARVVWGLLAAAGLGLAHVPAAVAENTQDFGNYVVHYNALTTDLIPPKVAETYQIKRSKTRGLVNIAVLKKALGTTGEPVKARLEATARNLSGQVKTVEMREVREGNAIYYLGEFRVAHQETLDFAIEVYPVGTENSYTVRFRHQFFTD